MITKKTAPRRCPEIRVRALAEHPAARDMLSGNTPEENLAELENLLERRVYFNPIVR